MKNAFNIVLLFCVVFQITGSAQVYYKIDRLGSAVNTNTYNEMAPVIIPGGILFSSNRKNDIVVVTTDQEGNYMYNLYFSEKKGEDKWSGSNIFARDISSRYNESSAIISPDGKSLIYTATIGRNNGMGDDVSGDTLRNGLFFAELRNEKWFATGDYAYNDDAYNSSHPCLSADGKRLYFASDRPGGMGGYDIYYSDKTGGRWTKPVNLGSSINTSENEVFPFVFNENRLYFASSGHPGEGNMDIFYSDYLNGIWNRPVNMPRPFNSRNDDFAFVATAEMDTGFFTSNRRGTDDIYSFRSTFPVFTECPEQVEETYCYEFFETGSLDLDTTSLKYEWDLGDSTRVRGLRADHCYEEPGYYLVQLNVIDTLTGEVYFSEAAYDLMIEKVEQPYMLAPDTALVNSKINFDASLSHIKSFTINEYYWDFGDGDVENEETNSHSYSNAGTYILRLGLTGTSEDNPEEQNKACANKQIVIIERE